MKAGRGLILQEEQERYLERLLPPREPLLAEMERVAAAEAIPVSDPEVGRLLDALVRARQPRSLVEVGTAIGYGALILARAAPEGRVLSIDRDADRLERARGYLERAGVAERVQLVEGEALEVLAALPPPVDFAYVDGDKTSYRRCLDLLLPKMSVGGLLVFDNLLWKGKVARLSVEETEGEEQADAIRAFNTYLMIHPQLSASILPLGDGVGVAVKTRALLSELGGPF
ncbi:MAG TPA: O-methyltransferase [Thermoanaerobaculia bacterium]|nr:O-methyltransferase [Thermoanaerobaculia bacterium]